MELKKLIKVHYTPSKLTKKVQENTKYSSKKLDIFVLTDEVDGIISSDLMVGFYDNENLDMISVCSIELDTSKVGKVDYWQFKELVEKALATKKQSTIKQFSNYKIVNTTDINV